MRIGVLSLSSDVDLKKPFYTVSTCVVLAVVLVEFYKNRRRNHQEILERGCGRVSNYWKPFTQATEALK